MKRIYADAETYFDKDYSLTKMTTHAYILDPRFKLLGWAIAIDDQPPQWYDDLPEYIDGEYVDYENSEFISHNSSFDAAILTLHHKRKAKRYTCTRNMAKALMPQLENYRLETVAPLLRLGPKTKGLTEGSDNVDDVLTDYALNDVELCRGIYNYLQPLMVESERELSHLTTRWGCEPTLCVDIPRMQQAADTAIAKRNAAITAVAHRGLTDSILKSEALFKNWLINEGLDVPVKENKEGIHIAALAKGDAEFQRFMRENPHYQDVWTARLEAKSNIGFKRPLAMIAQANLDRNKRVGFPLMYWGADTSRWSGSEYNPQNLPRNSEIRKSLIAPPGHVIVVADSSQIELRMVAWLSKETGLLDTVRNKLDPYRRIASIHFNKPVEDIPKKGDERQFGKVMYLGLNYGMGAPTFRQWCAAGPMGLDPVFLTEDESRASVNTYRTAHPNIVKCWKDHEQALRSMYYGTNIGLGPTVNNKPTLVYRRECVELPSGMHLFYPDLTPTENGWIYGRKNKYHIYGAKLVENIVQCLARIVVGEQIIAIENTPLSDGSPIRTVGSVHDEILAVVPENLADEALNTMITIMSTPPAWAPDLPLAAEGGYDYCYSK